jgi:UDP-N-acetylglucosamine 1-carboxyvinyltransferase
MGSEASGRGDRFVIEGGRRLSGTVVVAGNKNEALPVLAATLLLREPVRLSNVPRIRDVETLLETMRLLGVVTEWTGPNELHVDASKLADADPDPDSARKIRGSFLLAPPLLYRNGRARLPRPGGDKIGRRRVDTHLLALRELGAGVVAAEDYALALPARRFVGADVFLDEASVMATENAVMAAAVAEGRTTVMNAASEPHVQGLCRALNAWGARISGVGTNVLEIEGVASLRAAPHRIGPDHIEIGSFMALAAMTGGEIAIPDVEPRHLRMIRLVFARLGVATRCDGNTLVVPGGQSPEIQSDEDGAVPKVDDAPWPGFPADLTSLALVLATQCRGTVMIHEKLFESRLFFVDNLVGMGARIVLCDPHRAVVVGPTRLHGATMASPDIRAGMALIAAALCASGKSVIHNAHQVDRGYERIAERLTALGAVLRRE